LIVKSTNRISLTALDINSAELEKAEKQNGIGKDAAFLRLIDFLDFRK
jgi:hypothetical protein